MNEKIKKLTTKVEIKTLVTKAILKAEQDKITKLQTYDSSFFFGQSYFVNDGAQLYLKIQSTYHTLKRLGDTEKIVSWKCKVCLPKNVLFLSLLIIVFDNNQLNGMEIQIFV